MTKWCVCVCGGGGGGGRRGVTSSGVGCLFHVMRTNRKKTMAVCAALDSIIRRWLFEQHIGLNNQTMAV